MTISLTDGSTVIDLHPDLYWSDEHTWAPVEQAVGRTLTGALDVQAAARIAGRPITLEPEDDNSAWMPYTTVQQLRNWAAVPEKTLVLTLRGETYSVIFRHQDGGLEAKPVAHRRDVQADDPYLCVIRLMEV